MDVKKIKLKDIGTDKLLLMTAAGIVLALVSFPQSCSMTQKKETVIETTSANSMDYTATLEDKLENVIGKIDGVEGVSVMITLKSSKEKIVLKDTPTESHLITERSTDTSSEEKELISSDTSVLVKMEDGSEIPYVIKELEPDIEGVAVIYSGRTGAKTTYKITSIIKALFELEVHKISVIEQ